MVPSPGMSTQSHWPLTILGAATSLINLFLPLVLVRILPVDDVGHYKVFFLYLAILPNFLFSGGLVNGISYWAGIEDKKWKAIQTTWTLLLITSVFIFTMFALGHTPLAKWLHWNKLATITFITASSLNVLYTFYEDVSVSFNKIWKGAIFSSIFDLARNLSMLLSALYFRQIEAVYISYTAVTLIKILTGTVLGLLDGYISLTLDRTNIKEVLKYAVPVAVSSLFGVFASYSDQLVLSRYIESKDFALYTMGCLALPPLLIFEQSVNKVLIPKLSQGFTRNDLPGIASLFQKAMSDLAWLLYPAATGLIVFAEPIIELLFTKHYLPAAHFLRIYAVAHLLNTIPYDSIPRSRGEGSWILKSLIVFSATSCFFVFLGVRSSGAYGALLGSILSMTIMRSACFYISSKNAGLFLTDIVPFRRLAYYTFACVLSAAVSFVMKPWFSHPLAWFFVAGTAFSGCYFLISSVLIRKLKNPLLTRTR